MKFKGLLVALALLFSSTVASADAYQVEVRWRQAEVEGVTVVGWSIHTGDASGLYDPTREQRVAKADLTMGTDGIWRVVIDTELPAYFALKAMSPFDSSEFSNEIKIVAVPEAPTDIRIEGTADITFDVRIISGS